MGAPPHHPETAVLNRVVIITVTTQEFGPNLLCCHFIFATLEQNIQ